VVSNHFAVMCVIRPSVTRVIWRGISAYIVGSGLWAVMCAVSHSHIRIIWSSISIFTVGSDHWNVMCLEINLKQHQCIHTSPLPLCCDMCNKSFTRHSSLKIHQRLHTGERWLYCDVRNKSFNDHSNLKLHRTYIVGNGHWTVWCVVRSHLMVTV
jgi:hypothetical protein